MPPDPTPRYWIELAVAIAVGGVAIHLFGFLVYAALYGMLGVGWLWGRHTLRREIDAAWRVYLANVDREAHDA